MQVAPILTRRTLELLKGRIAQTVFDQLAGLSEKTFTLFQQYSSLDVQTMENKFPEFSLKYMPYRIALLQTLPLFLGESNFNHKYIKLIKEIEEEILKQASLKSLPIEKTRQVYSEYREFLEHATSLNLQKGISLGLVQDFPLYLESLLMSATEFDFSFSIYLMAVLGEIDFSPKEKHLFLLDKSLDRLKDLRNCLVHLETDQTKSVKGHTQVERKNLFSLAGSWSNDDTKEILAAIKEGCENIDAEW